MCVCLQREEKEASSSFLKKIFIYEAEPGLSFSIFDLPCGT